MFNEKYIRYNMQFAKYWNNRIII